MPLEMRPFVTTLLVASTFCLTVSIIVVSMHLISFPHEFLHKFAVPQSSLRNGIARASHCKTYLCSESSQAGKKSAFYTKESNPTATSDVFSTVLTSATIEDGVEGTKASFETNIMKTRLMEEVIKEDVRAIQLESLLEAFKSAVDEKEQLIALESNILADIKDVKSKVNDETVLNELSNAISEKSRLIDGEKGVCKEITAVVISLAAEISETRNKIAELQEVVATTPDRIEGDGGEGSQDYQKLLQSSIEVVLFLFVFLHYSHCIIMSFF